VLRNRRKVLEVKGRQVKWLVGEINVAEIAVEEMSHRSNEYRQNVMTRHLG
jgi:hypothetical protein